VAGSNLILSWTSFTGQSYQIQFKNNLNDPVWQPLGAPIPGTGSPLSATNALSSSTQRFFRLTAR
jgi:hypothetical protein